MTQLTKDNTKALLYALLNITSATGIVFANKAVFQIYGFHFTIALTWIHTLTTILGMFLFSQAGLFHRRPIPPRSLISLALAFVGYIVLCNANLNLNTVGFYQVTKIAVAPTVLLIESIFYSKPSPWSIKLAIGVVCIGVAGATVTEVGASSWGLVIGFGSVLATALYQIWAGTKQREFHVGSMQLLHEFSPLALLFLSIFVPLFEPLGYMNRPDTILGFEYSAAAVTAILVSSVLGLLVSLSTFLVIGATSSLTYNVVGHVKTLLILAGGVMFFGDEMSGKKALGIGVAFIGIIWYSHLKMTAPSASGGGKMSVPLIPVVQKQP